MSMLFVAALPVLSPEVGSEGGVIPVVSLLSSGC